MLKNIQHHLNNLEFKAFYQLAQCVLPDLFSTPSANCSVVKLNFLLLPKDTCFQSVLLRILHFPVLISFYLSKPSQKFSISLPPQNNDSIYSPFFHIMVICEWLISSTKPPKNRNLHLDISSVLFIEQTFNRYWSVWILWIKD